MGSFNWTRCRCNGKASLKQFVLNLFLDIGGRASTWLTCKNIFLVAGSPGLIPALHEPGMVARTCNSSIQEAEAGRSAVQGQPWPYGWLEASPAGQSKNLSLQTTKEGYQHTLIKHMLNVGTNKQLSKC